MAQFSEKSAVERLHILGFSESLVKSPAYYYCTVVAMRNTTRIEKGTCVTRQS